MVWPFDGFNLFPFNLIFGALGTLLMILVVVF